MITHILMQQYDSTHRELLMMLYRDCCDVCYRPAGYHPAEDLLIEHALAKVAPENNHLQITEYGVYLWEDYLAKRDAQNRWFQSNHRRRARLA